jgi:hypothetical protein
MKPDWQVAGNPQFTPDNRSNLTTNAPPNGYAM